MNFKNIYNCIFENFQTGSLKTKISSGLLLSTISIQMSSLNKKNCYGFFEEFISLAINYLNELEDILEAEIRDDKIQGNFFLIYLIF